MNEKLLVLPVLIPVLASGAIYFTPEQSSKRRNVLAFSAALLNSAIIAALLAICVPKILSGEAVPVLPVLHLNSYITLSLTIDGLSAVFLLLIAFLWPLSTLYAFEYMEHEENLPRFFAFYTLCYGITAGVALSGDMITMYFFYELLTLSTVPLVGHEGTLRAMKATRKYIIYSIGGAAMSFAGIILLYTFSGPGSFTAGGFAKVSTNSNVLLAAYMLTFMGFGVKAAVFPLSGWLPDAGVAPTPVTALLHAVAVVKSGVFASIRSTFFAFGPKLLSGTWAQCAALMVAGATVIIGSAMALREQHLKRRLAWSTVSNLSYILIGSSLMTAGGLAAGLSHMLYHGLMKITLFFCAGTVLCKTGREYTTEIKGLGRKMPVTFGVFTLASLALTGAPLLPGFISKLLLIKEAVMCAGGGIVSGFAVFGIIALIISALLTAAYLLPLCARAFMGADSCDFTERDKDPGLCMLIPFAVLCIAMVILGCSSGKLTSLLSALAAASA